MVLASINPTTAIIFGYYKEKVNGMQSSLNIDEYQRKQSGYNMNVHSQIVRYEMQYYLNEMEVFVAPTSINLENPTFWLNYFGDS